MIDLLLEMLFGGLARALDVGAEESEFLRLVRRIITVGLVMLMLYPFLVIILMVILDSAG